MLKCNLPTCLLTKWKSRNNDSAWNAKEHFRMQRKSPRYDRSQNPPISSKHDLTYNVTTPWPVTQGVKIFRTCVKMINARVLKVSSRSDAFYASYSRKIMWGPFDPLQVRHISANNIRQIGILASYISTFCTSSKRHVGKLHFDF